MEFYIDIPSATNTSKIITICNRFHTEFSSTYYNDKGDAFIYIFGQYIKPYMKEMDHPAFIQEWKLNLETAAYLKNLEKEIITSKKKEINRHDSQ